MTLHNPFETMADAYDAWFDAHTRVFESEVEAVRVVLPERHGTWVEIGVGTGRFASRLGIEIGVEPATAMAERARRRGIRVLPGSAEQLPFGDASVDAVFFITTLCFVSDVGRSLAEARRVLTLSGSVVIAFLPRDSALGRDIASRPRDPFFAKARLLSPSEVFGALLDAGFAIDRVTQTLTALPPTPIVEPPVDGFDRGSFVVVRAARAVPTRSSSTQS